MRVTIRPCVPTGTISAPPSKSMAHRMLICAGLADGVSTIHNLAPSDDILATINCLRALGAEITEVTESTEAEADRRNGSEYMTLQVKGTDPLASHEAILPCNESGSTLRFFVPVAALSGRKMQFTGSKRLMARPLNVYEDAFKTRGMTFEKADGTLNIAGRLKGGEFCIPGDISSQFVSGLLLAMPLTEEDSSINLTGSVESRPYIEMTMAALAAFGVQTSWKNDNEIIVNGRQKYIPRTVSVEGDWSNAAGLLAFGVEVTGIDENSLQGDKICREYFARLDEQNAELDISDCPDLGPILMAYAAMNHGCTLHGTRRLRIKESDRGAVMKEELAKFGVSTEISENRIIVGRGLHAPQETLSGHNDHRIVMAMAALCTRTGGTIEGAEAVNKSFPDFFDKLQEIGVDFCKE